jgi:hypothetical protein
MNARQVRQRFGDEVARAVGPCPKYAAGKEPYTFRSLTTLILSTDFLFAHTSS